MPKVAKKLPSTIGEGLAAMTSGENTLFMSDSFKTEFKTKLKDY